MCLTASWKLQNTGAYKCASLLPVVGVAYSRFRPAFDDHILQLVYCPLEEPQDEFSGQPHTLQLTQSPLEVQDEAKYEKRT